MDTPAALDKMVDDWCLALDSKKVKGSIVIDLSKAFDSICRNLLLAKLRAYGVGEGTIKDAAYYCYCAYVLSISKYSDFPSVILTDTVIFLRGLKLSGQSIS